MPVRVGFLDLPGEIRNQIYEEVFVAPEGMWLSPPCRRRVVHRFRDWSRRLPRPPTLLCSTPPPVFGDEPKRAYFQASTWRGMDGSFLDTATKLLVANKQVHAEAIHFLYGRNRFVLTASVCRSEYGSRWTCTTTDCPMTEWFTSIGLRNRRLIRNLAIVVPGGSRYYNVRKEEEVLSDTFGTAVHRARMACPGLRILDLWLDNVELVFPTNEPDPFSTWHWRLLPDQIRKRLLGRGLFAGGVLVDSSAPEPAAPVWILDGQVNSPTWVEKFLK
ncbi:hypothetical protein B0H66DRAFT_596397 [Apodospora peruviana]|uniref:F-box domain-containing protein n=1 Tax=Apodospora peruviana TaxID=516989 RepID=A0AAE0IPX5_9PEZI|nr:hypothetical protein B0H66DRAFT_596397 [Apodospora peruviana]